VAEPTCVNTHVNTGVIRHRVAALRAHPHTHAHIIRVCSSVAACVSCVLDRAHNTHTHTHSHTHTHTHHGVTPNDAPITAIVGATCAMRPIGHDTPHPYATLPHARMFMHTHRYVDAGATCSLSYTRTLTLTLPTSQQDGWTALHWAAWKGLQGVVETLVSHGADTQSQNDVRVALAIPPFRRRHTHTHTQTHTHIHTHTHTPTPTSTSAWPDKALSPHSLLQIHIIFRSRPRAKRRATWPSRRRL
jgi:hypothetical protein